MVFLHNDDRAQLVGTFTNGAGSIPATDADVQSIVDILTNAGVQVVAVKQATTTAEMSPTPSGDE
jgi:hypothetical protein